MDSKPIKISGDHADVLQEISVLMVADPKMVADPNLDTPDGDQLDLLITLVQACEAKHFPIAPADAAAPLFARHGVVLLPMAQDAKAVTLEQVNQSATNCPDQQLAGREGAVRTHI